MGFDAPKLNYLVSFPKSGNTWMRFALANYLMDQETPVELNALAANQFCTQDCALWASRALKIADNIPMDEFFRIRPIVARMVASEYQRLGVFPLAKSHSSNGYIEDQRWPFIDWNLVDRVVYIVRNPIDIAPSLKAHMGLDSWDDTIELLGSDRFLLNKQKMPNARIHVGSWSKHVLGWLSNNPYADRVICVKYEDLETIFPTILKHYGIDVDNDRVHKALSFSSLKALQEQEEKTRFKEMPEVSVGKFFGGQREALPPEYHQRIIDEHGEVMERLGYLNEPRA